MNILKVTEFDYRQLLHYPVVQSAPGKKKHKIYCGCICAFDIECTNLPEYEQAVMYAWKIAIDEDYIIAGRTWEEYQIFVSRVNDVIPNGIELVIYVHNLSYEWCWLAGIFDFKNDDVFAVDKRKILKCKYGKIEYRCSYLWSNMSLKVLTNKYNVAHKKLSGDKYDYSKKRYWFTPLSDEEEQYQINDVLGLVESIKTSMRLDDDDLTTIPLTSTGYPRRDMREAVKKIWGKLHWMLPSDPDLYRLMRAAFRGGDTHTNRFIVGDVETGSQMLAIHPNVKSADMASCYPAVLINEMFPMSPFMQYGDEHDLKEWHLRDAIRRGRAVLAHVTLKNVELINKFWASPYISYDRCTDLPKYQTVFNGQPYTCLGYKLDNGRILQADTLSIAITDVDLAIIDSEYKYSEMIVHKLYTAKYGKLPKEFRDVVKKYYAQKTELKGAESDDDKIYYDKLKALLNSLYGMTAQDVMKEDIIYDIMDIDDAEDEAKHFYTKSEKLFAEWLKDHPEASAEDIYYKKIEIRRIILQELLQEYLRGKGWLPYQWGIWTTAHARYYLSRGLHYVQSFTDYLNGEYFIYCDTDSIKYRDDHDLVNWDVFNEEIKQRSIKNGGAAKDKKDKIYYLGIFEPEATATRFVALGAKKYLYQYQDKMCRKCPHFLSDKKKDPFSCYGKLKITIAGVGKKEGAAYLVEQGGLEAFVEANNGVDKRGYPRGFVFPPHGGGGTLAKYNDKVHKVIEVDGHKVEITPNVYLADNFKTVKRGKDYFGLTVESLNDLLTDVELYLNSVDRDKFLW